MFTSDLRDYDSFRLLAIKNTDQPIRTLQEFNQMEGNKIVFDDCLLFLDSGVSTLYEEIDL